MNKILHFFLLLFCSLLSFKECTFFSFSCMNTVSFRPPAWTSGLHKVIPRWHLWTYLVKSAAPRAAPALQREWLSLAGLLSHLLGKGSCFQGAFTSVTLQERILGNSTGSGCLKIQKSLCGFYTPLQMPGLMSPCRKCGSPVVPEPT